jgi:predicted nucleotidyltransferase component of viral defense system
VRSLRSRIQEAARQHGVPPDVVEKDYALSYVLAGVSSRPELTDALVFKGGTALKKLFFGDYRFSEDLDFSSADRAPKQDELAQALHAAAEGASALLSAHGPFAVEFARYPERGPHPRGQEAFVIRVQFPWHRQPLCSIKLEVSHDEPILLAPQKRPLIHGYEGEELLANVCCYQLEEIVAEKLRTLLQTEQRIIERGWSRRHARDYYDLWRILEHLGHTLDADQVRAILQKKCAHREVGFDHLDDFFTDELLRAARLNWNASLQTLVPGELPDWDDVLVRLKALVGQLTLLT